jgi:diguanylate cyclase (GGDEF)-like protein/PAS domain S-box-containing protein
MTSFDLGGGRAEAPSESVAPADGSRSKLFELSHDLLATIDAAGCFVDVNPAWGRVLGWSREELLGSRAIDLLHPDDLARTMSLTATSPGADPDIVEAENRYRCADGSYRWLQWNARRVEATWYTVARDVTERRILQERALRDPLTGLSNRTALTERLAVAIRKLKRDPGLVAILFIDLDHFKVINDGRGHEVGDRFLCVAAARLLEAVRDVDLVARLGGDEFVILVENTSGVAEVIDVAHRVVTALHRTIEVDGDKVRVDGSVGISVTSSSGAMPELLLREADIAMYRAKDRGGACYELFDFELRAEVKQRVMAERELRVAIDENAFVVHYQPIVSLPDMHVGRYEALVRWQHRQRGLLPPDAFIPLAEETGVVARIGELVLREACRQTSEWRRHGLLVSINVNVSTQQLDLPDFVESVRRMLAISELPPTALCLELTETQITKDIAKVSPSLQALQRIGVRIAMDDFGSGYSSLRYLRLLPLDVIKIDRSFVSGIVDDSQDRAVVAGIVMLGRETAREVIAEGVETEPLNAELIRLGCGLAQGFLYDKPMPPGDL